MTTTVGHAGKQVIFSPVQRDAGSIDLGRSGVVAGDQVNGFAVGGQQHGMDAMVATSSHAAELIHLVQLVVPIRVGHSIQAALNFSFVVVDPDVERIEGP